MKIVQRVAIAVSSAFVVAATMSALPASAALQAVGPVSPVDGFPVWYQDAEGLAIEFCKDPDNPFCLADPVIVGNPFSEEIGFGGEAFYWTTEALMDSKRADGTNGRALMVLALESAFLGGDPVPGDQMTFGRLRFFIDVPAAGRYKITHPFGIAFFDVSAERIAATNGVRAINANRLNESGFDAAASTNIPLGDFGCEAGPCDFTRALQSGVGPFLTWDTFNVNPALTDPLLVDLVGNRYVGNPLVDHKITGSPFGTNVFQIEGPNGVDLDPAIPGVQRVIATDDFSVSGKVAVIDTVPPVIASITPAVTVPGATNVVLSADITDDLGVTSVTADLGALSNSFTASLSGSQEVPPTASPATGSGTFTIDTNANTLSFNITTSGLTGGAETGAHIHGPAASGVNAPIVFALPLGASKIGVWNYPEAMEADILAGRTYVNVHTLLFPNGEIRGQILPTPDVRNMILTAGTRTSGTWGLVIPSITRTGAIAIPVTATDGSNSVTVNHFLFAQVLTSVSVAPATSSIAVGATQQLTAAPLDQVGNPFTAAPATVTWSSDNTAVATVDAAGLVTGVSAGSAIITASAISGATTVTGTAAITVTAVPGVCQTTADTDGNGIIGNLEILNFVRAWKAGQVTNLDILRAIGFWKAGVGC